MLNVASHKIWLFSRIGDPSFLGVKMCFTNINMDILLFVKCLHINKKYSGLMKKNIFLAMILHFAVIQGRKKKTLREINVNYGKGRN